MQPVKPAKKLSHTIILWERITDKTEDQTTEEELCAKQSETNASLSSTSAWSEGPQSLKRTPSHQL